MLVVGTIFVAVLVLSLSLNQGFAAPEIDDEVIVGFEKRAAKAIPDWVNTTMKFYLDGKISEGEMLDAFNWLFENNILHLSAEAAQEMQDLRNKLIEQENAISSLRTLVSSQAMADDRGEFWFENLRPGYSQESIGERIMQPEYGVGSKGIATVQKFVIEMYAENVNSAQGVLWLPLEDEEILIGFEEGDPDRPIIIGRIYNSQSTGSSDESGEFWFDGINPGASTAGGAQVSPSQTKVIVMASTSDFDLAKKIVDDVLQKGGTADVWEKGIAAFGQSENTDSVADGFQGIVVLCNNEIDKQTQQIEAELKIIEHWLQSISEEQESAYDDAGRLTSGTTSERVSQYRESDLDFISRHLASIDQKIKSLETGIKVLEKKSSFGDDTKLANMELQNSLQKLQQTLQTLSNVSKMHHDTAMAVIRKMG